MNKKQQRIYGQYLKSNNCNLYDCYKRPSDEKLDAEFAIIHSCRQLHGKRFRILSYNSYTFTCAFTVEKDGEYYLIWHSPYKRDCFKIPEFPTQFT